MKRTIMTATPYHAGLLAGRTIIKLDCGHERSIGGHRFLDGSRPRVGASYECSDSYCGRKEG